MFCSVGQKILLNPCIVNVVEEIYQVLIFFTVNKKGGAVMRPLFVWYMDTSFTLVYIGLIIFSHRESQLVRVQW